MSSLPVIVGFGGISPAGRSSGHQAFRRIVLDRLDQKQKIETILDLAVLTGRATFEEGRYLNREKKAVDPDDLAMSLEEEIKAATLIRKLGPDHFDAENVPCNKRVTAKSDAESAICFTTTKKNLPNLIPDNWSIQETEGGSVRVEIKGEFEFLNPDSKQQLVSSAGQLPGGFDPGSHYASKNHPRGLQMTVWGVSDALNSMGFALDQVEQIVRPDQIGVYASSSMGLLDDYALGGYMKAASQGKRASSKQMPFSFAEMPADFINAYALGSLGHTGGIVGACSSFLYNLDAAVRDIQTGRRRFAIVGGSEAPLLPEVFEGYRVMSALAEDAQLLELDKDKGATQPDHRRACRPFSNNCGFTMAESAQFLVLADQDLALELGARVFGSVASVFVHADGIKKSISSPGVGNYLTMARAAAMTRALLGEEGLKSRSFVHAHGTGTPQNRVTESHILDKTAEVFGIKNWPVAAIKCYLGHPIGTAGGDQIASAIGTWAHSLIPGIFTLDQVAEDVSHERLQLSKEHIETRPGEYQACLVNTKGFGGNNATAVVLSPEKTMEMIQNKVGEQRIKEYRRNNEKVEEKAQATEAEVRKGNYGACYRFGEKVFEGEDLEIDGRSLKVPGYDHTIDLEPEHPYPDMAE